MSLRRCFQVMGLFAAAMLLIEAAPAFAGPFPTLDKIKSGPSRFKAVLGGAAFLDKETGLVWEKQPAAGAMTWDVAIYECLNAQIGGRFGWRLPAAEELATLLAREASGAVRPPFEHKFVNVNASFWSASHGATEFGSAYVVHFTGGNLTYPINFEIMTDNTNYRRWCVRGGRGSSPVAQPLP